MGGRFFDYRGALQRIASYFAKKSNQKDHKQEVWKSKCQFF
jgi:hypothetical protein